VTSPAGDFGSFYIIVLLYEFCIYGCGYIITWFFPQPYLFGVIVALLCGLGTGGSGQTVHKMGAIGNIVWSRYFGEAFFITEVKEDKVYPAYRESVRDFADAACGFDLDNYGYCLGLMVVLGVVLRLIAYGCMRGTNRQKQK